ncbi:MAG: co-chaperone GroES [Lachnospiraceae bacterium]|nr:co-chaperone GroES [Lachnospiraceae bacterium]
MKLVPLGNRLVIKQAVAEETTKSGIVLTGQTKEKPQEAEVIAVGPEVKGEIKVGDTVIYSKYAGTNVKVDDVEYIIVNEEDVLAMLS